jgi:hypothetical protein
MTHLILVMLISSVATHEHLSYSLIIKKIRLFIRPSVSTQVRKTVLYSFARVRAYEEKKKLGRVFLITGSRLPTDLQLAAPPPASGGRTETYVGAPFEPEVLRRGRVPARR